MNTVPNPLPVGFNSLTMSYSGDSNWTAVTSAPVIVNAAKANFVFHNFPTSSSLSTGTDFAINGSGTWSAVATPPTPLSSAELMENGDVVATAGFLSASNPPQFSYGFNVNSRAHPLAAGAHTFTVYYPGDVSWNPATSTSLSVTITPIAAAMSLTSNLGTFGSMVQGTAIMYSAKMTGVLGVAGGDVPYATGAVQFYVDGVAAGSAIPLVNVSPRSPPRLFRRDNTPSPPATAATPCTASTTTSGVVTVVTRAPTFSP